MDVSVERDPEAGIVRYGPAYAVPARFMATVTPDKPGLPICHLIVVIENGRAACEALRVERRPDEGKPITGTVLRDLAVGEYVKVATAKAAMFAFQAPVGTPLTLRTENGEETAIHTYRIDDEWVAIPTAGLERSQRFDEETQHKSDRRQRGTRITDDELREVASIYRAAHVAREAPTAAVAAQRHVSRSTAGRQVQEARARGFLGPTRQRVAGEDS